MKQSGYVNGDDLLVYIKEGTGSSITRKAVGHCTSHTATFNSETKDIAVKPVASVPLSPRGPWKNRRVTALSAQVKCSGLHFYGEEEGGFKAILAKWAVGKAVELELMERKTGETEQTAEVFPEPYASGSFVISSLEHTAGAKDDVTYDVIFDNAGPVDIDESKLDHCLES